MKKLFKLFSLLLAAGLFLTLTACAPKNMDAAKEKLEDKGYTVVVVNNYFVANKGLINGETITGYLYESKKEAKDAIAEIEEKAGDLEVKQSGKWIYFGTEEAMKDFD